MFECNTIVSWYASTDAFNILVAKKALLVLEYFWLFWKFLTCLATNWANTTTNDFIVLYDYVHVTQLKENTKVNLLKKKIDIDSKK